MATEFELAAAEKAAKEAAPGMGGFSARAVVRAALEAAERVRDAERRRTCLHPNRRGNGSLGSDGSSEYEWWCPDCGVSHRSTSPGRGTGGAG